MTYSLHTPRFEPCTEVRPCDRCARLEQKALAFLGILFIATLAVWFFDSRRRRHLRLYLKERGERSSSSQAP